MRFKFHHRSFTRGFYSGALVLGATAFVGGYANDTVGNTPSRSSFTAFMPSHGPSMYQLASVHPHVLSLLLLANESSQTQDVVRESADESDPGRELIQYGYVDREKFSDSMKKRLSVLNDDIGQFETMGNDSGQAVSDAAKADSIRTVKALRDQSGKIEKKLEEISDVEEQGWNELKSSLITDYTSARNNLRSARQQRGGGRPGVDRPGSDRPEGEEPDSDRQGTQRRGVQQSDSQQAESSPESGSDLNDYSYGEREEFTSAMKERIAKLNADIDQLAQNNTTSSDANQAGTSKTLNALREQSAQLDKQLEGMSKLDEADWITKQTAVIGKYTELHNRINSGQQADTRSPAR